MGSGDKISERIKFVIRFVTNQIVFFSHSFRNYAGLTIPAVVLKI